MANCILLNYEYYFMFLFDDINNQQVPSGLFNCLLAVTVIPKDNKNIINTVGCIIS